MNRLQEIIEQSDREAAYMELTKHYASLDEYGRQAVRGDWDFGVEWIYPDPYQLCCKLASRFGPLDRIRALLMYSAIENFRGDWRANLYGFCLAYHSLLAIGVEPSQVFEEVAEVSSDRVAIQLRRFVARSREDKSLEAFYLEKTVVNGETRFRRKQRR